VSDRRDMTHLSPLQRKLRDKASAAVVVERSRMLEPLHAVLRERASNYAYTLDTAAETAASRAVETMLPNWGGSVVAETGLPDGGEAIAATLVQLAHSRGSDCSVVLWFEATLNSQSSLVAFDDCRYGIFAGKLADLAHVVGLIKGTPGSPVGWSRLALVSADHRWMIWIEADRATLCTTAAKG